MSALLEEVRKYIGTESEPIIYHIDKGAIKFFAESIMDPDPLYRDEGYAKKSKHGEIIAPPTFYGGASSVRNLQADDPRTVSSVSIPMPSGWVSLNAGDDFELLAPIRPGDTLTCREKVVDAYEKQGSSGHLIFTVREKTFTNQHGELVLIRRVTGASRGPAREEGEN